LSSIKILEISSPTLNPLIQNLVFDSRNVTKGSLFFALPGNTVHGNTFIQEAIKKGAVAIIYQDEIPSSLIQTHAANIVMVKVQDSRYAMSPIADSFYDSPSSKLKVIGVTGTEGKSTTTYLIWQLIQLLGAKAGFISTVQTSLGTELLIIPSTLQLQKHLLSIILLQKCLKITVNMQLSNLLLMVCPKKQTVVGIFTMMLAL
jgi:UDP-N-acetylmuramoyl-L-alanyl-D-glutamate--2,6-diaminopimelate ligase